MGRIKTALVKRIALKTYRDNKDGFTDNFEANKKLTEKVVDFPSKKLRNVITGYVTRLTKQGGKSR
ncbi:30S ribosomal protein S17e [Candidatus Woesearchaeota archaeon]|nr:30S ribosomal protein S17e [Candidatus Woesearchaeota archaeon]